MGAEIEELNFAGSETFPIEDIRRAQSRVLEMADAIVGVLDEHGIPYSIAYGTLLGAVRHGGFIPWDDDFDIFIMDEDYENAMRILRDNLPDGTIMHDSECDPKYCSYWLRVVDTGTETFSQLYPKNNEYKYTGLNVDLFPLERLRKSEVKGAIYNHNLKYQKRLFDAEVIDEDEYEHAVSKLESDFSESEWDATEENGEALLFCSWLITDDPTEMFPLASYTFEGRTYSGPADADRILTRMYGNYMELPKPEDRLPHYSWVKWRNS